MMAWVVRAAVVLAILTAVYLALSIFGAVGARRRFRREYGEAKAAGGPDPGDRDSYVAARMEAFNRRTRWRLALLIYAFPVAVMAVLIWLAQFS